jgi:hypothetical protein
MFSDRSHKLTIPHGRMFYALQPTKFWTMSANVSSAMKIDFMKMKSAIE